MAEITLFCEDSFHEKFIGAMLRRFGDDYSVGITSRYRSSRGGLPRMHQEFKEFLRDVARQGQPFPDSIVVVVDANCEGYNERKKRMDGVLAHYPTFQHVVLYAIPDPHIERWMLVDPKAFQAVFGRGCTLPATKCAKDEYKKLLRREIRESGIEAPLGGEEFAEDIVMAMNLAQVEAREPSLGRFLQSLKAQFKRLERIEVSLSSRGQDHHACFLSSHHACHRTRRTGVEAFLHAAGFEGQAAGFNRELHGARHLLGVFGFGNGGVHEHAIGAEFHRNGGV